MTLRETSLPLELLQLCEGETVVGYQILSGKIIFKVVSVTETEAPAKVRKMKLGDWGRKWAGAMKLHERETVESIRDAATIERFGA